jgi:Asp/Glu/hydantoin racemase
MELLIVNPNISDSVSALIRDEALRSASPGTGIEVATARAGVAYIETRFEAMLGAHAAAQVVAERWRGKDAVIVAAFGDPGLAALREVLPCPVTGLTEAALASACLMGQRFSIVAISRRIRAWYAETVAAYRLEGRLASIRGLDEALPDIGTVQDDQGERLVELAARCVAEDGADVIVLAGAPLAGLARRVKGRLPVPVVDGVSSAVRHAETLVALAAGRASAGSFAPPPAKAHAGLTPEIVSLLAAKRAG